MRTSLINFFKPINNRVIGIVAANFVDFKSVDARIKHDDDWMTTNPMLTEITVPEDCANEIIDKLKLNPNLISVNGEMTGRGMQCK